MKNFFYGVLLFFLHIGFAWATEWTVWTLGPAGEIRETMWEVRPDPTDKNSIAFSLKGQDKPLYIVHTDANETRIDFASGMHRRFAPGPLMVTDLPFPLVLPPAAKWENMTYCSMEHTGGMKFKTCTEINILDSLPETTSLSALPPNQISLVLDSQGVKAMLGSNFRAERE